MKRLFTFLLWSGLLLVAQPFAVRAQAVRLAEQPDQFIADVPKLMATGGPAAARAGQQLTTLWSEGRLNAGQRTRLIALSRAMNVKRYAPAALFSPLFTTFYHATYTAQPTLNDEQLDNLLTVFEKQFALNQPKALQRVLETASLFLEKRAVYSAKFNRTYLNGGSFVFKFLDENKTGNVAIDDSAASAAASAARSRFDGWDEPAPTDSGKPRPTGPVFIPQRRPIPVVTGAVLSVQNTDLAIVAQGDSALLTGTSADVMLTTGTLVGKGGRFTWAYADRPDIYVTLADYSMATQNPRLSADDATLTMPAMQPQTGVFEYVAQKRYSNRIPTQPRFMSWRADATLPNLGPGLSYRGGIALAGAQLTGASASGQPSVLTVSDSSKVSFRVESQRFIFGDSVISAPLAKFVGRIAQDSIMHPGRMFRYNVLQRIAWLDRAEKTAYARVPFVDSYHKFYIWPEVLRWDVARGRADLYQIGAKREVPIRMESFDYFQPQRYADLSADYSFHPLQIIANYVAKTKQQWFLDDELTRFAPRVEAATLRGALNDLVLDNYLERDAQGRYRLSRKGALYVLAYNGKSDFDNFQISSRFTSSDSVKNASIDLKKDLLMTVRGVQRFTISDSLKIFGYPNDRQVQIGKGRSFLLNGTLRSGTFRYTGQNMGFDYDKFALNMQKIESITFTPQKLAAQGRDDQVGGDIKYEKPGTVFIAGADNRSGQIKGKKATQRLVMPEGMTVYFNQPSRGDRLYNERVYFKIPAIDNDSLGKGDISFVGTFHSDGIFPPMKAELKTMADNTLGFEVTPPAAGLPVYAGKKGVATSTVKFGSKLVMDNSGLRATGTLNHLTTTLQTDSLLFMPDSLLAQGPSGTIKEGLIGKAFFPQVAVSNFRLRWLPRLDSMIITTQKQEFAFYNNTARLEGDLVLRSAGLFGQGTLRRADAEAISQSIKFNKDGFVADNAQFKVQTDVVKKGLENRPILLGNEMDVDFNQLKGIVTLTTNRKSQSLDDTLGSSIELPYAGYKTNINRVQWNFATKTIAMKGDPRTSRFTATAEEQEGLTFNAGAALYDVEKMTLNVSGVPYVTSADARIYPDKSVVTIRRNGEMLPLTNARLELDTISRYHRLKGGSIKILSRTRFEGSATYQLATARGDTVPVKMGSFELKEVTNAVADASPKGKRRASAVPEKTYYTVARADIDEADRLMLTRKMQFRGNISMEAPQPELAFDGFVKPALKRRSDLVTGWIPFKEKVQETIDVPVNDKLKNDGEQLLVAGIYGRLGEPGLYPAFLSPLENPKDPVLYRATGVMRYDEKDKLFRIIQKGPDGLDNVEGAFTFNDERGVMTFGGPLNLLNSAQNYGFSAGSARVQVDSATYRINALLGLNFPVPEALNAAIADKLVKTNLEEKNDDPADDDLNRLSDKLLPIIGAKAVDDYRAKAQNNHVPLAQASPKLAQAIILSNVNLRWSPKHNAFYSIGKLGVSNLLGVDINAEMDGMLEIRKTGGPDELTLYVEASPDVWVFYDFNPNAGTSAGQLAIGTSESELNDRITAGSANSKGKSPALSIVPATADERQQFMDRYLDQYKTREKPKPKPATVAKGKLSPKEKEKKKDKEDEKEGF